MTWLPPGGPATSVWPPRPEPTSGPGPGAGGDRDHDHRRLGRELALFDTDPLMGAGLPYWLPDGAVVRHTLEEYVREAERRAGYRHVYSPVLGKRELYEISGHWEHYRDDMFPPMVLGGDELVLRPSLCPHHALIFKSRPHSYRDLPLRIAELGPMYRAERSGVLGGLVISWVGLVPLAPIAALLALAALVMLIFALKPVQDPNALVVTSPAPDSLARQWK